MPSSLIVYHANCIDGAASAWAISQSLTSDITYIPYAHFDSQAAEKEILKADGKDVSIYFVDVTPDLALLDRLLAANRGAGKVAIIDHHKSAAETLKNYTPSQTSTPLEVVIDAVRPSAALMAWEYAGMKDTAPALFTLIDKMDGDAKGLKTRDDFSAAAYVDTKDIRTPQKAFDALRGLAKLSFNDMAQKGRPILDDQENRIQALLDTATTVSLQILPDGTPVTIPFINANVEYFGRMISDEMIATGKKSGSGIAMAWSQKKTGAVSVSLRSNGTPDCSAVAAYLCRTLGATGGGHAGAAALHFPSLAAFQRAMLPEPPANGRGPRL